MNSIDTLLSARWVLPVEPDEPVRAHDDYSVAIDNGVIVDILPTETARRRYQAKTGKHYPHHVLMPGLINAHTHAAMSLFRGLADDLPLMDWLENHIWPAEAAHVNESFVQCGAELAIAEMLRAGTTCFNDMYFFPDVTARVAAEAGIRACVGLIVLDFPTIWANTADEYLDKSLQVSDQFKNHELITTAFAPHAPYTVSDPALQKITVLANEMDIPVHIHLHETREEIDQALQRDGCRPLKRLARLNMLSPSLQAVHMTCLEDGEIDLLAETGANVIHCPESNMKLASGICPTGRLLQRGVNVALGTDSASSNNDLDMFSEMRSAALLAKVSQRDATALPAGEVLKMATIRAARAMSLDTLTGSLQPGKAADIIAVNFDMIESMPVHDPVSHLVYCTSRHQVEDVWIAGKLRLCERRLTSLDEDRIKRQARDFSTTGKPGANGNA